MAWRTDVVNIKDIKMKKKILSSLFLSFSLSFGAGIPVIDAVSNAQQMVSHIETVAEWAKEAQRWIETAQHYKSQIESYQNELMTKTGIRDSVGFLKDLNRLQEYSKMYGDDYLKLGEALLNENSMIGRQSRQLFDKYNVFDRCGNLTKEWQKESCQNVLIREVATISTVKGTAELVDKSQKILEDLSKKASNSQDIKESQDIANAINIEIAQLQATQMKLDMLSKQNEAEKEAENERYQREFESKQGKYNDWSNFDWSGKK